MKLLRELKRTNPHPVSRFDSFNNRVRHLVAPVVEGCAGPECDGRQRAAAIQLELCELVHGLVSLSK